MFLMDTSALSEAPRRVPAAGLQRFNDSTPNQFLFTSVIVVGELYKGAEGHPDVAQQARLLRWIAGSIIPQFEGRILDVSLDVSERWGAICGQAIRHGQTLPPIDALIAATALVHGLTVVTRNEEDFRRCGASVRNPWNE